MKGMILILFIVILISGCAQEQIVVDERSAKYCKANDGCQALSYILKNEYLSGAGKVEVADEVEEYESIYIRKYEWNSGGYEFKFTDDRSGYGGNYVNFRKNFTIFSTSDEMLDTEKYPFLKCDDFSYKPDWGVSFSIKRTEDKTEIWMSIGTGMIRSYKGVLDIINEEFSSCEEPIKRDIS